MSLATIRTQIKTILEGVSGMGIVHEYERWAVEWKKFLELYKTADGKINGWTITRTAIARRQITLGQKEIAHIMTLRGFYGLKDEDESESAFQEIVENVANKFDDYETLNDTCLTTHPDWGPMNGAVGLQVEIIEPRFFGNVLCHYVESRLCAIELKDD